MWITIRTRTDALTYVSIIRFRTTAISSDPFGRKMPCIACGKRRGKVARDRRQADKPAYIRADRRDSPIEGGMYRLPSADFEFGVQKPSAAVSIRVSISLQGLASLRISKSHCQQSLLYLPKSPCLVFPERRSTDPAMTLSRPRLVCPRYHSLARKRFPGGLLVALYIRSTRSRLHHSTDQ